ncbi:hypothetical protein CkaCkLH20_12637 [Colletotrichum karsti]|uniref:Clr5 domain-containing protein n=1 Tax=Colletotrichum karsti TaxID=1095194 RepID=A0A9P6HSS1_9PEZI|nr:uncharacterized protein CkaCkLH20_12637 [Colletotrichum karsti]KAF9869838.1 hypothetical protein CkaCkLH20_12637 [Colletotrichum karsti]
MPTRPRKVAINDREWEKLRHVIRQLYLQEDRTLKDVLVILGTLHNFHPSKSQLEGKLKQWHMTKNMTPMEWKYLAKRIQKRRNQGKESSVYLSGMSLRPTRIERSTSRYCYETAIEKAMKQDTEPWGEFTGDLVDRVWDDAYKNFLEVVQSQDCSAA